MKLYDNTILITGGGSGIGRALAEALHKLGNKVIIAGRRQSHLDAVVAANPGIEAISLDVTDPASIDSAAKTLIKKYPTFNVLINNSGIMVMDDASGTISDEMLMSEIATNLVGPIRLTSALVAHLKQQKTATIIYNSSYLGFTPLAMFAVYSATKAALHSYAMSQRFMLRDTSVKVQEIVPPWVATGLVGPEGDPRAVPVATFIKGTMEALATDAEEVIIEEAKGLRNNAGPKEHEFMTALNTQMTKMMAGG